MKRRASLVSRVLAFPFIPVGRFLLTHVFVPVYRLYFLFHRLLLILFRMAKSRLSFLTASSRLIHVAVIFIVLTVIASNVSASGMRADVFGRQSILYKTVASSPSSVLETEVAASMPKAPVTSYLEDVSVSTHIYPADFGTDETTSIAIGSLAPKTGAPAPVSSPTSSSERTGTETYQVADGDTLGQISNRFGLDLNTLLWANDLHVYSLIHVGQSLRIPPENGVFYAVKSGDSIAEIARDLGADTQQILTANHLASDGVLLVGKELFVPGGELPASSPPVRRPSGIADLFLSPPSSSDSHPFGYGRGFSPVGPVVFATAPSSVEPTSARGSAGGAEGWVWPTDWHIITQYFSWKHTGVDIGGTYANHTYAAAAGIVVYAGWRTGYGMTIEIDNGNGYITRYAHHSKLYVHVGERVEAGQIIGQIGMTGNATGPHIHFEVIKDGKFQNPLEYIR